MADEQSIPDEVAEGAPAKSGGKNPLVTILLVLNAVAMGAVAYFQFMAHQNESKKSDIRDVIKAEVMAAQEDVDQVEGEGKKQDVEGQLLPLDAFTANLAQGDGPRRFIRLSAVLKFSVDSQEEEFKSRKPQIRDTVISILNSKRPEDLLKVEGKSYLKEEIKAAINSFLVDGNVIDVFYVAFQIN